MSNAFDIKTTTYTAQNVSVFGVILVSPYSARIWENADQNNSEYGHFSLTVILPTLSNILEILSIAKCVLFYKIYQSYIEFSTKNKCFY